MKLDTFIWTTLVYSAELLTDFSYTNFTVSYTDALDRLRVHLNIILLYFRLFVWVWLTLLFIFVVHSSASDCLEDRLWNDLQCVERDVEPYSLTHSLTINTAA